MAILFIADLHLNEQNPTTTANFIHFLHEQASQAKTLYILGDFFDYWIGDDDYNLLRKTVSQELKKLQNNGTRCYFIHGNRDFLLSKIFARESGIILLPEEKILTLHGYNILILHGDTLCTTDINYHRYRKYIYNRYLQQLFLTLPLSIRHYIAKKIRKNSKIANNLKLRYITDVNLQTVIEKFEKYQVDWIIHGHTHRPGIYKINIDNKILYRAVLSDWYKQGSMIKIKSRNIELIYLSFY